MNRAASGDSLNIFEQISKICRDFRKQISQGNSPRIENFLTGIDEDGQENLFSNLLEIEVNFRQRKREDPSTNEYLGRFPQFAKQVRRAFFEPTMASIDSASSTGGETRSFKVAASPADVSTFDIPDANRLGDYELIREVGRGGMGVVYEASHTKTGNRVALKTLPTGGHRQDVNADKLYRFRKEFRRLSEINDPNLVGMQTLEVDGSQWFFTMDLIDGEDFLSFVRPNERLDETRLRSCLTQLAKGVMALHRQGIIHRDLKPSNVLVSGDGRVLILDFGLAAEMQKTTDMTQTKSGMFAGTPRYAAPEQMFGERTEASDWYAVGTMVYEALTGLPPFTGKNQIELLRQKQNDEAPPLSEQDGFPEDLAQLVDGLIRREPSVRLTADAISDHLQFDQKTRTSGSTAGSQAPIGSVDGDNADLEKFAEEEVVLIGRDDQLAQLESIKQEFLETRKPPVVWVTGLSGEGKSSLVEKFLRPIRTGTEMLVLSGRCYDRESVPFKVIDSQIDALVRYLRSKSRAEVESLLPDDIEMLAQLFPVMRRVEAIAYRRNTRITGLDDKQIHNLAFAALRDLLVAIGHTNPLVMFVDDLQWGDSGSAEFLVRLLSPPNPPPILFLGSFRSDERDDSPFLQEWNRRIVAVKNEITIHQVKVEPLTEAQCMSLFSKCFGKTTNAIRQSATDLFKATKGNPYFLELLLEGYDAETRSFITVPLPEIIENRLRQCPLGSTELLNAIAISGKAVALAEVAAVVDQSETAIATITHMRSERLVRLISSPGEQLVDTYHDKIRESALSKMTDTRRRELHLKYAETIESETKIESADETDRKWETASYRVFDLAHHYLEANDPRAFRYQLQAGKVALESYAMENALAYLKKAEQLQPSGLEKDTQFQLQFMLAKSLAGGNFLDQAVENYHRALELSDTELEASSCYLALGEIHWKQSDHTKGLANLNLGFARLGERLPTTLIGKLTAGVFSLLNFHLVPSWFSFRLRRKSQEELALLAKMYALTVWMVTHVDVYLFLFVITRCCVIAKHVRDPRIRSEAYASYASNLAFAGLGMFAKLMMSRANKYAVDLPDGQQNGVNDKDVGFYLYSLGRLDKAEKSLTLGRDRLARSGHYDQIVALHMLWHLWAIRGHAGRIILHSQQEEKVARRSNDHIMLAYSLYGQAEGLARQGNVSEALALAEESLSILVPINATFICVANIQKARVQLQAGDYEVAESTLGLAIRDIPKLRLFDITAPAFPLLVESLLGTKWAIARETIARRDRWKATVVASIARKLGLLFPNARPHAFRVSGRVAVANGKTRKALKYFDKATTAAERIGAQNEHARTFIDKSTLDYSDANTDRQHGLELLESLGCVLPDAEVEYLGIDRAAHHARAAAAREFDTADLDLVHVSITA